MGNPNRKRNILASLAILLLLGLLAGMVWYDRQSKLSVNQDDQVQTSMNHQQEDKDIEEFQEDKQSQEDSDQESQADDPSEEKDNPLSQEETDEDNAMPESSNLPSLADLEGKDTPGEFQATDNQVTLRSIGGMTLGQSVSKSASMGSDSYKKALEDFISQGYQPNQDGQRGYDFGLMFQDMAPFIAYADMSLSQVNQAAAYPQLPQSEYPTANAPSAIFYDLAETGVDYVSLASGHIYDKGASAIQATVNNAKNADLKVGGAFTSQEDMDSARIEEINGMKIGFLSYTMDLNGNILAEGETHLTSFFTQDMMAEEVAAMKELSDGVVVNIYTSEESMTDPNEHIQSTFQTIADAGANVIIGHNPNALQGFQWLNNQATLVLNSQASFLTSAQEIDNKLSGIFEFTFVKSGDQVKVDMPKFMPTITLGGQDDQYYRVVPLADYNKYDIPQGQELWNQVGQTLNTQDTGVELVSHLETADTVEQADQHR